MSNNACTLEKLHVYLLSCSNYEIRDVKIASKFTEGKSNANPKLRHHLAAAVCVVAVVICA